MGKLVLGLDIGITSVGWGIIDIESNDPVDCGVRLFKEGTAANNEERRTKRSSRRMKRRNQTRRRDLLQLLKTEGIYNKGMHYENLNPYEMRKKGLNQKLTNEELVCALVHLTKHRGSSLESIDDEEGVTKEILAENDKKIKEGKYVCEIQLDCLKANKKIRGINNNFRTSNFITELKQILSNQELNDSLNEKLITLVSRKRRFDIGPGSFKSQTKYGPIYNDDGSIKVGMIEKMTGKCSLFPEELRAPKYSYAASEFNLLNDLNNLSIGDEKISKELKIEILEYVKNNYGITVNQLCSKFLKANIEDIVGFRIDKNGKPLITEFVGYKELKRVLSKTKQLDLINDVNVVDDVICVLCESKNPDDRKNKIELIEPRFSKESLEGLISIKKITGYHSMSFKAFEVMRSELIDTNQNQMQIIHNSNLLKDNKNLKGQKKIFADDEAILSPVAKRAQRETMKVVNRLRELYGEFDSIVVETTRYKNSKEEKDSIKESQKYYENMNKKLEAMSGLDNLNSKQKLKLRLYLEQDAKTAYTQQPIDLRLLLSDVTAYEVDHIIPISVSLDDSMNNKVLVTRLENQEKGNLTPIAAYQKGKFSKGNLASFKAFVLNARKSFFDSKVDSGISKKKAEYLLLEKDLTKFDTMKDFINRNLVDTSYANRVVFNTMNDYFKQNEIGTKVHTVRGSATSAFRKRASLPKNREEDFSHHALDALIVASIKKLPLLTRMLNTFKYDQLIDDTTGEIKVDFDDNKYYDNQYINYLVKLKGILVNNEVYKYSHKIDTKADRKIADDTIYSTRTVNGEEMIVKKYKNIYDPKEAKIAEDILNNNYQEKYLMYRNDPQTFEKIIKIVNSHYSDYKDNEEFYKTETKRNKTTIKAIKNPLADYYEEHGAITKYSKKNNGPEVHTMKYFDSKLGNKIDITNKYKTKNKRVVLQQISPYRTDFYYSKQEKTYKFITIRYSNIRKKDEYFTIDKKWYDNQKVVKEINDNYDFCFSMHRDELICITKKEGKNKVYPLFEGDVCDGVNGELLKFTATNNDKNNVIEVKPVFKREGKRLMPTISSDISRVEKYSTDVVGNLYKVSNQMLKLKFK